MKKICVVMAIGFSSIGMQYSKLKAVNLVYIDSSCSDKTDCLRFGETRQLIKLIGDTLNSSYFYYSNGEDSRFGHGSEYVNKIKELILLDKSVEPDLNIDHRKLRSAFDTLANKMTTPLHIHYFLSDKKMVEIQQNKSQFVKLFPREIAAFSHNQIPELSVTLYFSNIKKSIDTTELREVLKFGDSLDKCPAVRYRFVEVEM
ncbi:MAG: hypothetical protein ACKVOK_16750 [Flavobacteriales bacterium]